MSISGSALRVPARYYARVAEVLARQGIDMAAVLAEMGWSTHWLDDPDAMLKVGQVDQLLQHLADRTGRSDLAFELGKLLSATAHSFVGFAMLNSATLDQALRFEAQYFRLIMPSFDMRYVSAAEFGEMRFTPRAAMSRLSLAFHLEGIGVAALREVADLTGNQRPPCRLELSIAEPPHVARYHRELGDVAVRFNVGDTPGVRVRILSDPRALRLAMADSSALKLAEARCRNMVQKVSDGRHFADWVAMTLHEVADGLPGLDELAATLNMSGRTLNRYLAREGTSYRALSARIQHQLACERLALGMSVTDVAYSLGFTDRANFARAFRRIAGYSPSEHGQRQAL
ncbi:AraC family transcriptional regulator [Sinimarinibacterium sp. NLF-5-8]|uniref:AraC family transcriptional regulator n=1 Tax=Sinimarinibacterium sp. NLF-5-8 TaxID=2698684 RepID=UPI001EE48518|nr:AraC family transcriptional regulator [Sinimarinibacterium sp. NLF-5-8]